MELVTKANSLWDFYSKNPEKFEDRVNTIKKYRNYALAATCLVFIIFPGIIPFSSLIIRIVAVLGLLYFGFSIFAGSAETFNKESGGLIKLKTLKKFDMSECDEATLINAFNNRDFGALADAPEADNQPIQLNIDEDKVGKELYCVIMKYYSSSDYRSATDVIVLSGLDYSKWVNVFKA